MLGPLRRLGSWIKSSRLGKFITSRFSKKKDIPVITQNNPPISSIPPISATSSSTSSTPVSLPSSSLPPTRIVEEQTLVNDNQLAVSHAAAVEKQKKIEAARENIKRSVDLLDDRVKQHRSIQVLNRYLWDSGIHPTQHEGILKGIIPLLKDYANRLNNKKGGKSIVSLIALVEEYKIYFTSPSNTARPYLALLDEEILAKITNKILKFPPKERVSTLSALTQTNRRFAKLFNHTLEIVGVRLGFKKSISPSIPLVFNDIFLSPGHLLPPGAKKPSKEVVKTCEVTTPPACTGSVPPLFSSTSPTLPISRSTLSTASTATLSTSQPSQEPAQSSSTIASPSPSTSAASHTLIMEALEESYFSNVGIINEEPPLRIGFSVEVKESVEIVNTEKIKKALDQIPKNLHSNLQIQHLKRILTDKSISPHDYKNRYAGIVTGLEQYKLRPACVNAKEKIEALIEAIKNYSKYFNNISYIASLVGNRAEEELRERQAKAVSPKEIQLKSGVKEEELKRRLAHLEKKREKKRKYSCQEVREINAEITGIKRQLELNSGKKENTVATMKQFNKESQIRKAELRTRPFS